MGVLPDDWTLPALSPHNRAWFTSGTLAVQRCASCETLQHPPEEVCHVCLGTTFDTVALAPRGTVHSYTVVHHATNPALAASVPYAVVLVSLDDAPHLRVVGNMPGTPCEDVKIGTPVSAFWEERVDGNGAPIRLVQWRRTEEEG
jgi:hypothetical protein